MKRRRHTPEQIIRKLREAERMLSEGAEVPEVAKALEVSEQTFHRWRTQYGGMKADDAKRGARLSRSRRGAPTTGITAPGYVLRITPERLGGVGPWAGDGWLPSQPTLLSGPILGNRPVRGLLTIASRSHRRDGPEK